MRQSSDFFKLTNYLDASDENWKEHDISMIINAERNIGKSYNSWEFIDKEIWQKFNYKYRIAYLRTNLMKLKTAREDFNSRYKGQYYMSETKIYKQEFDENGKEIFSKRLEIGAVCGVNNSENYKSARFDNYVMIFWDEYNELNELKATNIWGKWIDLFKTIKRFNTPFIALLVGNKINPNNDILVNLEIELPEQDLGEDVHIELDGNIHFWDISKETFKALDQSNDMVNIWARYNEQTDMFLNGGGYLVQQQDDVLIYRRRIQPTARIRRYISYGDFKFEYGDFEGGSYFHMVTNTQPGYRTIALDNLGYIREGKSYSYLNEQDYDDFAELLARKARAKKLFYSTFETKQLVEPFIIKFSSLIKD